MFIFSDDEDDDELSAEILIQQLRNQVRQASSSVNRLNSESSGQYFKRNIDWTHWPLGNVLVILKIWWMNKALFTDILSLYVYCEIGLRSFHWHWSNQHWWWYLNQSINQSNPVLLKERVRIPRTRRAGGSAMLWGRLPLDGVGSCRLFFTDDLHDNLSWVPASDKPHTFKSCFTHSSQVFFGRPGPFLNKCWSIWCY